MFDRINISTDDLSERAVSRTLSQFRKSQLFIDVLIALISEIQVLLDTIIDTIESRTPALAEGEQLNAIGRIVGQNRTIIGYDTISWFTPDRVEKSADQAPAWVTNAPLSGNYVATDSFYRQLIEARVTRNFVRFASVLEIQDFVNQAFNIDISFVRTDIMTVNLIISQNTSSNVEALLTSYVQNDNSEYVYFLPLAAGVKIGNIIRIDDYLDSSSGSS